MFLLINFMIFFNYTDNINSQFWLLNLNSLKMGVSLTKEMKSQMFFIILLLIVMSIYLFKKYYMSEEHNIYYFNFLFYWFVMSMMIILYCNNWVMMIIGWDMLGISSYLLIIFYNNMSSMNSGHTTMNTNRLGDVFLISFIAISFNKNLLNFNEKFNFVVMFLLICLLTKSAQFPFSSWLPLAMAAPTPVSSLVHSSTLVTAGLFIFYKSDVLFNNKLLSFIMMISLWTSIYSGLMAMVEEDMKKMIALSTLSQLSFMFIAFSLGMIFLSFLHLLTHAVFKASLFFWSGLYIHNNKNEQLFNSFNQKSNKLSQSFLFLVMVSLMGIPFSLGFFSKDQIIDLMIKKNNLLMNILFVMSIYLTTIYTIRLMKKMTTMNFNKSNYKMFYFNMINCTMSSMIFSVMLLMSKLLSEHWFKTSFIMISKGWKNFFFLTLLLFIVINWYKETSLKLILIYKMLFLNLFTMKTNTMKMIKKNKKSFYFDFGWINFVSTKMSKNILNLSKIMIKNKKNKYNLLVLMCFLMMNVLI